jgi:hypothetical protein
MEDLTETESKLYNFLLKKYRSQKEVENAFDWDSHTTFLVYKKSMADKGVWLMEKRVKQSKGWSRKVYKE